MSFNTISSILRGAWLIDRSYAVAHLPWVMNLFKSGTLTAFPRTGEGQYEGPFIIDPATMRRYEWRDKPPSGSVAVIPVTGPILKYDGECGEPGSVFRQSLVQEVDARPELAGAFFLYDTPGGQASGTGSLATAIRTAKKKSVAYVDDGMAASAGIWLLSASAEAYVSQQTDMIGSVGAYSQIFDFTGYLEKEGVKLHEIYAPQSVDKRGAERAAKVGDPTAVESELAFLVDGFISFVAARSPLARASVAEWSTGKMYYASEAQRVGLIDGILPIKEALLRVVALNKSTISTNNKNSTNMAFEKTLTVAQAEAFAVVEGGFLLSEDDLNKIEACLTTAETKVTTLSGQVDTLTAAATVDKKKIEDLAAENARLAAQDAGSFSKPDQTGDDTFLGDDVDPKRFDTSADRELRALRGL